MSVVWPFPIRETFIESNEWLTDVIRAKGAEQRFAMRRAPRQRFQFLHSFTEENLQAARAIVRQNPDFLVPDWSMSVNIGAVAPGSDGFVNYGEPYSGLSDGDTAILWESVDKYEAVVIENADSADGFFLDNVENTYERARLLPARTGQAPDGLNVSRVAGPRVEASIDFDLTDSKDIGRSNYARYEGNDLVTDCPVISSDSFEEPIFWPTDDVDGGIPYPTLMTTRNTYDARYMMRWHVFTRDTLYTLRRFIHSRRGRWKSFWLPSFKSDLVLAASIGSADTSITVYAPNGVTDLGVTSFDIEINQTYYRRVTSYSTTTANGLPALTLNITATGENLNSDVRVSFLRHLRFEADRVEFQHAAQGGTVVSVPCIEVAQ